MSLYIFVLLSVGLLATMGASPMQLARPTPTETSTATMPPTPTRTPIPTQALTGEQPSPSTWNTNPIMLSSADQIGWFPDIFADSAGIVHVVWASGLTTGPQRAYDIVLYRKTLDGTEWTDQTSGTLNKL